MGSWYLTFRSPTGTITLDACATALKAAFGTQVTTTVGKTSGNPHDSYWRHVRLATRCADGGVSVEVQLVDTLNSPSDSIRLGSVQVGEYDASWRPAPYATRLAAWHALRDAFATLGFTDKTADGGPSWIIDDAEAAGDLALARELRAHALARVLAKVNDPTLTSILLSEERVDVDAVLAAYPDVDRIQSVVLERCGLTTRPADLARFQHIDALHINEKALDGTALRGLALPKLTQLWFAGGIRRLTSADVAGFPAVTRFGSPDSTLFALDPEIIDVWPNLAVCSIQGTPLSKDREQMATLQARWPKVRWELQW